MERDYLREELRVQLEHAEKFARAMDWNMQVLEDLSRAQERTHIGELQKKDKKIAALERQRWLPGVIIGAGWTGDGELRGVVGIGWKF